MEYLNREINRLRREIEYRGRDRNDVTELRRELDALLDRRRLEAASQPHPRTQKPGFV